MIYLDHASTSPLRPAALEAMLPHLRQSFGNPSSIHRPGREALAALEEARASVAASLGAHSDEIVFTSGGTESNNLALRGMTLAARSRGRVHIVTTAVEHGAVLETCTQLENFFDVQVTRVPVDSAGRVDPASIASALTPQTVLISVMYANNEVGTVQPIQQIAALARAHKVPFHTDAVQAAGALSLEVTELGCDLLSLSPHKFGGPRGIGVLYVRRGLTPVAQLTGGGQEHGLRSGTENVAAAVGAAAALQQAQSDRAGTASRLTALRDFLIDRICAGVPGARLTGHPTERLPGHASFVFPSLESQILLLALDQAGIAASAGSACTVGQETSSHVLTAMGIPESLLPGALRLTIGHENTSDEIDTTVQLVPSIIDSVQKLFALA